MLNEWLSDFFDEMLNEWLSDIVFLNRL